MTTSISQKMTISNLECRFTEIFVEVQYGCNKFKLGQTPKKVIGKDAFNFEMSVRSAKHLGVAAIV